MPALALSFLLLAAPSAQSYAEPSWSPLQDKIFFARCLSSGIVEAQRLERNAPDFNAEAWKPYFICRAFLEKKPQLCRRARTPEAGDEDGDSFKQDCLEGYEMLLQGRAGIEKNPREPPRCEGSDIDFLPHDDKARRMVCRALEGYRKALAAKDPRECGGSSLCLALMGDAVGCEEYAKPAVAQDCEKRLVIDRNNRLRIPPAKREELKRVPAEHDPAKPR